MNNEILIPAPDTELAATLYSDPLVLPAGTVVLLNSAMGMPRNFYRPFAEFLASEGIETLTWDYRGINDSLQGALRESDATIHDWGEQDLPAVIEWMQQRFPRRHLVIIAHSVGGQILGMTPKTNAAARIVMIASQSGYWRLWSGWQQLRIGFLWNVVIPLVSRVSGYFPARWFGLGVNLPNGVAREWARWGRDPDYLMSEHRRASSANYAALGRPLLNIWISDDNIASYAANRRMLTWYPKAVVTNWNIRPEDLGVRRIGHFRLFRGTVGAKFWPRLLAWILQD